MSSERDRLEESGWLFWWLACKVSNPVWLSLLSAACRGAPRRGAIIGNTKDLEVKSSMKKTILKTVFAAVLISLCVIPFAYSAHYPPPPKTKIFFSEAPSAVALYGLSDDNIVALATVVISSTYGPFTLLLVEQGKVDANGVFHYVDHLYTDNVFAAQKYELLLIRTDTTDVCDSYDVTWASIVVTSSSADQLSVSASAWTRTGKISITAQFTADTTAAINPTLHGGLKNNNPEAQYNGVSARRDLSTASITGVDLGGRTFNVGNFRYIQTLLFDPSLLS